MVLQNQNYCQSKFYIVGIGNFYLSCYPDLGLMIFIYELDPCNLKIYRMCKYELYVKAFESYRLTYIHTYIQTQPKLYTMLLHGW